MAGVTIDLTVPRAILGSAWCPADAPKYPGLDDKLHSPFKLFPIVSICIT